MHNARWSARANGPRCPFRETHAEDQLAEVHVEPSQADIGSGDVRVDGRHLLQDVICARRAMRLSAAARRGSRGQRRLRARAPRTWDGPRDGVGAGREAGVHRERLQGEERARAGMPLSARVAAPCEAPVASSAAHRIGRDADLHGVCVAAAAAKASACRRKPSRLVTFHPPPPESRRLSADWHRESARWRCVVPGLRRSSPRARRARSGAQRRGAGTQDVTTLALRATVARGVHRCTCALRRTVGDVRVARKHQLGAASSSGKQHCCTCAPHPGSARPAATGWRGGRRGAGSGRRARRLCSADVAAQLSAAERRAAVHAVRAVGACSETTFGTACDTSRARVATPLHNNSRPPAPRASGSQNNGLRPQDQSSACLYCSALNCCAYSVSVRGLA
jgi:hypothetical protein